MTFLAPIAGLVAAAITVPLLVALYFLKLRRKQLEVSSTLLWKRAIQDLQVNAPFQKLKKSLLLLLQLLLLAALLLAFAGPMIRTAVRPGRKTVIVIDQSASMSATDAKDSRLDQAKEIALRLVDSAGAQGEDASAGSMMVVSFGHQARVVQPFTSDQSLLRSAIRALQPTDQLTNLGAALQLVEPFALEAEASGDADSLTIYVITDGKTQETDALSLRGGKLVFERVGGEDASIIDNLAITSMSARRDLTNPRKVQVFAQLTNYGSAAVTANVSMSLDGQLARVAPVTIGPVTDAGPGTSGGQPVQFELELAGSAMVNLSHDHDDMLAADDAAAVVIAPPEEVSVLLVTAGNAFLEKSIEATRVSRVVVMTPAQYESMDPKQLAQSDFDVVVFDSHAPKQTPPMDSLSFGVVPPIEGLSLLAARESDPEAQVVLDWRRDDPLLSYVVLDDMIMSRPGRLALPANATVLATGQTGPVIALVETSGEGRTTRHLVAAFPVLQSNWPMQVSFAVFMSNVLHTLGAGATGGQGIAFTPGEAAAVPASGSGSVRFRGPVELSAQAVRGYAVLPIFERVGVYTANEGVGVPWDRLAVNLTDPVESDLRPVTQLQVGTTPVQAQPKSMIATREAWRWFVWAALGFLMVEWVVYTRRMHL